MTVLLIAMLLFGGVTYYDTTEYRQSVAERLALAKLERAEADCSLEYKVCKLENKESCWQQHELCYLAAFQIYCIETGHESLTCQRLFLEPEDRP